MSEPQNTPAQPIETATQPTDVRAELKKNIAEEFDAALSEQPALTDTQRLALASLLNDEHATSTSILKALTPEED